jgi:signal peptidase I
LIATALRAAIAAAIASFVLAFLVPRSGGAAAFVRAHPLGLWCVAFVVFAWVVHHWWPPPAGEGRRGIGAGVVVAVAAAVVAWSLRAFVFGVYQVTSASMLPTLAPGDLVLGEKLARLPARGDVVVVRGLVKRVIGLPGDRVAMQGETPVIDDRPADSCDAGEYVEVLGGEGGVVHGRLRVERLDGAEYLTVHSGGARFDATYTVGPDEVFVLGDDRGQSVDSRSWNGGRGAGVPIAAIDAKVVRFLVGRRRSGDADWSRWLRPLADLERRVRVEGVETAALDDGIARCADARPKSGEAFLKIGGR